MVQTSVDLQQERATEPSPSKVVFKGEGLGLHYKLAARLWLGLANRYASLRWPLPWEVFRDAVRQYRGWLQRFDESPWTAHYEELLRGGYVKQKHWVYAAYMSTLSTLPLLLQHVPASTYMRAILGKTALGMSTKLMDTLNDRCQDTASAFASLDRFGTALVYGNAEPAENGLGDEQLGRAENAAVESARWVHDAAVEASPAASRMLVAYGADAADLIRGQRDSLRNRDDRYATVTVEQYLTAIAEKSIGGLWLDVDLCALEAGVGHFDRSQREALASLKTGTDLVFKSTLVYDDVQDVAQDLHEGAVNMAVLLGTERGLFDTNGPENSSPEAVVQKLDHHHVLEDAIHLADLIYLQGVDYVQSGAILEPGVIDWEGYLAGCRFVRLFNLRKLLRRRHDFRTLRQFLGSLRSFHRLRESIPEPLLAYERLLSGNPRRLLEHGSV